MLIFSIFASLITQYFLEFDRGLYRTYSSIALFLKVNVTQCYLGDVTTYVSVLHITQMVLSTYIHDEITNSQSCLKRNM